MKKNENDAESNDGSTGEQIVLISKSGGGHQVDRNMLLRTSGYFHGLANSGMRDAHYRELTLECLTDESLIEVKDYLSKLSTNVMENGGPHLKSLNEVEAGLDGAFYLLINDMIDGYIELLLKHLDESTCIRVLDIANKHVLINQVVKKVIKYMSKNFKEISERSKTLLSPDEMFYLVASEEINADSEIEIFNLIIKWISEDQSRKCFAEKLLTEVRYNLMTTNEKQKYTAILHDLNLNISCSKDKDSNISRTVGMLFVIGSTEKKHQAKSFFNILPVYDFVEASTISGDGTEPSPIKFKPSRRKQPPFDSFCYTACVVDNCLYLIREETRNNMISRESFVYNPVDAVWSKCPNMHLPRRDFYLGGLSGHLYAVSGRTRHGLTPTVEKYVPSENRWYMVEPIPLAVTSLAGCVCNGMMFVSGGADEEFFAQNQVYRYDPSCNKWFSRAPMLTARFSHVMTCTENKIFVVGGKTEAYESEPFDFLKEEIMDGEMYDVESDQWSSVLKLKLPVCDLPSITINNFLYIFHDTSCLLIKLNLGKYLKEKKTSNVSSSLSVQDRNANNNNDNLVTNEAMEQNSPCVGAHPDDDCQILTFMNHNGKTWFDCRYFGVMLMSDV
ncbi:hypothetical protein HELRODRAFT_191346 [Helobdella robusta]|uniref:BACK domain-containing protein n=1 Tax=Helobdella robusta TaxID=6412 RepID=T1FSW9_HELRO|nr:hypothetical protein HELRODRAFT_191346 [Helobdella robusta]ESO05622.1 hypothetical protein HELRODRAFT_191346 [Helobdella robusta]